MNSTRPDTSIPATPNSASTTAVTAGAPLSEDDVELARSMMRGTLCEKLGMDMVSLSESGGVMTMPVAGNTQPIGLLHGGATIALAETVASFAGTLRARTLYGENAAGVGTSVSALHHRSGRSGIVTATAVARHLGRSVTSYLVDVHDDAGVLLSTVTVSVQLLPPRS